MFSPAQGHPADDESRKEDKSNVEEQDSKKYYLSRILGQPYTEPLAKTSHNTNSPGKTQLENYYPKVPSG